MSKHTQSSRPSISSVFSIPLAEPISFEKYLQLAQEMPTSPLKKVDPPPPPPPSTGSKDPKTKSKQVSNKYGIHVNRNKKEKGANFIELNRQTFADKKENAPSPELHQLERKMSWRNLIKGVLDSQRGKIPLLLAVEAGNQSMCRELLSTQTTEQLQVSELRLE